MKNVLQHHKEVRFGMSSCQMKSCIRSEILHICALLKPFYIWFRQGYKGISKQQNNLFIQLMEKMHKFVVTPVVILKFCKCTKYVIYALVNKMFSKIFYRLIPWNCNFVSLVSSILKFNVFVLFVAFLNSNCENSQIMPYTIW